MNADLLVVVLCYNGDEAQVRHQLPTYLHHDAPVLVLSPEDAPVTIDWPGVENRSAGLSGWKGAHVARKLLAHWKIALEYPQSWFLIHEPDTLCLSPELPPQLFYRTDLLWSNTDKVNEPGFMYSPPWFCHRSVLERLVTGAEEKVEHWNDAWSHEHDGEDNVVERIEQWNEAWAGEAGKPGTGEGMGNSEMVSQACASLEVTGAMLPNSVWTYKESDRDGLLNAVRDGAIFVHGLKTPGMYDALKSLHAQYESEHVREVTY